MTNSNSGVLYNRTRKMELVTAKEIPCGYCPFHRNENRKHKPIRSNRYKHIDRFTLRKMVFSLPETEVENC